MPISIIVALIALLAGGGVTMASQASLPGETLYQVKTATEDARMALTFNPEAKAKLGVKFAAERIAEIKELLEEKGVETKGLEIALAQLEKNIAKATAIVEQEKQKGEEVGKLAGEIVDNFHIQKKEAKQAFENAKREFSAKKRQLHEQLLSAIKAGDLALQEKIKAELIQIKAAKEEAEAKKDAIIEALEAEKEELEDELEEKKRQEDEARDVLEEAEDEKEEAEEKQRELDEELREEQVEEEERQKEEQEED